MHPNFHLLGFSFNSYGILVSTGYLVAAFWLWKLRPEMKAPEDTVGQFWALIYSLFFGAILGGRIAFYIVEWRYFKAHPVAMLLDWRNGWVFWGGALGIMLAGAIFKYVFNRTHSRPRAFLPLADYFATVAPLCHAIGRLGCFFGGCCYGRPTSVPWAVRFTNPQSNVARSLLGVPLHPTQLYEAAGEAFIFAFLYFYVLPRIRRKEFAYGTAFFGYVFLYSMLRFTVEFFRGDDRGVLLSPVLSPSQWISLGGFLVCLGVFLRRGVLERNPGTRSIYLTQ